MDKHRFVLFAASWFNLLNYDPHPRNPRSDLKRKIIEKVADWRGMAVGAVPEWFELDDADFVDLLNEIKEDESGPLPDYDSRM